MRLQSPQSLQYLRALLLGVFNLLREEVLLGALGGEALLVEVPRLSFADQLYSIEQHGGICALPVAVIRRGFLILLVAVSELLEEVQDLPLYLLVIADLVLGIKHKLMQEVLYLDVLAETQRAGLEMKLYAMLRQEGGEG